MRSTTILVTFLAFFTAIPLLAEGDAPKVETLELVTKFDLPTLPPSGAGARDVRWASKESVYLAYGIGGAFEFDLRGELVQEREMFPPGNRSGATIIKNLWSIAADKDTIIGHSPSQYLGWRKTSAESTIQLKQMHAVLEDLDVQGDRVVLLGHPGGELFEKNDWAFLWMGTLTSDLTEWRALGLKLNSPNHARIAFNRRLGSARFLSNGNVIVVPVVRPGAILFSSSGKELSSWSLLEIENSLRKANGVDLLDESAPPDSSASETVTERDLEKIAADLESRRLIIEDVVPLAKKAGLLVRSRAVTPPRYYLGVLSDDIQWYELPIKVKPATVLLRGDALEKEGKLAVLVTDRWKAPESSSATDPNLYIIELP